MASRLVKYTEDQQLRSPTQAGYRPQLGTMHQAFALQHVVDKHKHARKPLCLCFVDLKSAYDKVQWQLLWQLLQRLGVHGDMLSAIRSLYDGCLLSMRVSAASSLDMLLTVLRWLQAGVLACVWQFLAVLTNKGLR